VKLDFADSELTEFAAASQRKPVDGLKPGEWPKLTPGAAANDHRHFLIVTAPFGPFGGQLGEELRSAGARATRVLLNAGDIFDWGVRHVVPYFGAYANWTNWLKETIGRYRITDVIAHGDSSPYGAVALAMASELGIRRHVLEHGYFRPNWVTLEAQGVNANSHLPRDPLWYRNHPAAQIQPDAELLGRTTPAAVWHITAYHLISYLGFPFFPRFRAHYADPAWKQGAGHVARYGLRPFSQSRDRKAHEKIMRADGPVFLCALQRPGDSQLWRHSQYAGSSTFIERVVASFATCASTQARLMIRPHPLDPGLISYSEIVKAVAQRHGVIERVGVSDFGKLHEVLPRMAGVVCINSTAGLAAIEFGKPTITLGHSLYDMPGMTHQGDLDDFWSAPQAPDAKLYAAFRRVVMAETQINGAFATAKGRRLAVPEIARRLLADD
jgi:capsular polysaccharide export protein